MIRFPTPTYVGIDPGDRWVGVASLTQRAPKRFLAEASVYDRSKDPWAIVRSLRGPWHQTVHVAIEEFRVRPVRHNAFSIAETAQLIGAIKYELSQSPNAVVFDVPASSERTIELLPFSNPILVWRKRWPASGYWGHAISAWRVLGQHLLTTNPKLLRSLGKARALEKTEIELGDAMVVAPGEIWEVK